MMKYNNTDLVLQQTTWFIQKDFELEEVLPEDVTEEELLHFIGEQVKHWLDTNMEHLFYVLYRLDINEPKVHQALAPTAIEPPHQAIAKLILDREIQKAEARLYYCQKDTDQGDGWNS